MTDKQILRLVGQRVRATRLRAGMTQECLAELVGVHWKTVSNVERGNYPIAPTILIRLLQFLEADASELPGNFEPPDTKRAARIKKALARKRAPAGGDHR